MNATTGIAVLAATIGLLALSACVHDDGDDDHPPATGEMDVSTDTLDDFSGANAAEILGVTAQAALSLPQFGSGGVVQSAGVGVKSASSVSTTFDGTDLTITISREDGSALTLNSGSDLSEGPEPVDSPIPGRSAQRWVLPGDDADSMSIAIVTVTANENDPADYLTAGHWVHIAVDVAEFGFAGLESGVFVDGPELSLATPASLPVHGTASYYGWAGGAYNVLHGTDTGVIPGSTESGMFDSTVELTADFAAGTISGCVGCRDAVRLIGVLQDPDTGEERAAYTSNSGYSMRLEATPLRADGTFVDAEISLHNRVISIDSTRGRVGRAVLQHSRQRRRPAPGGRHFRRPGDQRRRQQRRLHRLLRRHEGVGPPTGL